MTAFHTEQPAPYVQHSTVLNLQWLAQHGIGMLIRKKNDWRQNYRSDRFVGTNTPYDFVVMGNLCILHLFHFLYYTWDQLQPSLDRVK